ncbi:MAG: tetratricopeptide repeat protein [Candidatus Aminicenantes bacterium]|jgi:Tol biopolymer transport system component
MRKAAILTTILILVGSSVTTLALQNGYDLFQKALAKERGEGNLEEAIALYQKVIEESKDESLAAKAQLRIGICYEKLGKEKSELAQEAFRKVVDNYPQQVEEVKVAREKLLILQKVQTFVETNDNEFRIQKVFTFGSNGIPSWDGRLFSGRDNSGDVVIIDIATKKKKRLTNEASWEKGNFVGRSIISPDSKYITYGWCRDYSAYNLKIAKIDGSEQKILHTGKIAPKDEAKFIWPYDWTPDSNYIVGTLTEGYSWGTLNKGTKNKIVSIDATDGSINIIQEFNDIGPEALDLSPDGRWLAYEYRKKEDSSQYDIFLMKSDGDGVTTLVKHPANDRLLGWTPGSDSVLIVSDRAGSWDAWLVPVKGGIITGEPILVKRDFGQIGGPTGITPLGFTQDGCFYYEVHSWLEEVHIASLDMEKTELLSRPKKVAQRFQGTNCYADWSPDGKYLAFSSRRGQNSSALCLFATESGKQQDIFPELETFIRVNWFPDGKSVLVVGSDKEGRGGIYRVEIPTGKAIPMVTEGSGFHSPKCSPDGKYVYYEEDTSWDKKVFRIMKLDVKTGQREEICRSPQQIIRMDISPDGKWLAFLESANNALKVMSSSGGQVKEVFKFDEGWSTSVAWSPKGKYLFFSKVHEGEGKTGNIELWRIPAAGGKAVKFPLVAEGMENLRIHPDGTKIAFNTFEVKKEVWVMKNFLPKK